MEPYEIALTPLVTRSGGRAVFSKLGLLRDLLPELLGLSGGRSPPPAARSKLRGGSGLFHDKPSVLNLVPDPDVWTETQLLPHLFRRKDLALRAYSAFCQCLLYRVNYIISSG